MSDDEEYSDEEFCEEDIDDIENMIKSLFDNKYDSFAHLNRDGKKENTIIIHCMDGEIHNDDYDSKLNKKILKKMNKTLSIIEERKLETVFNYIYNGSNNRIIMSLYPNYRVDEIYFIFTLDN